MTPIKPAPSLTYAAETSIYRDDDKRDAILAERKASGYQSAGGLTARVGHKIASAIGTRTRQDKLREFIEFVSAPGAQGTIEPLTPGWARHTVSTVAGKTATLDLRITPQHKILDARVPAVVSQEAAQTAGPSASKVKEAKEAKVKAMLNLGVASPRAPIRILTDDEFEAACGQLARNFTAWRKKETVPDGDPADNFQGMPHEVKVRLDSTKAMLLIDEPSAFNLGYFVGEAPAGLMTLSRHADHLEVDTLVGHPMFKGAGGALIEQAVNLSQAAGHNGALRVTAVANSIPAYKAMGFVLTGSGTEMKLEMPDEDAVAAAGADVADSLWARREGQWRLKKHMDKVYVSALLESAPRPASTSGPSS